MKASSAGFLLYAVVGLLLCLGYARMPDYLEQFAEYGLFGIVLSLGMLHGSLDYEIEHGQNKDLKLLPFLARYLAQMALVALVWLYAPQVALLLFLAYTAWHFGETDFSVFQHRAHPILVALYGVGITGWILGIHLPETLFYLKDLSILDTDVRLLQTAEVFQTELVATSLICLLAAVSLSGLFRNKKFLLVSVILLATTTYLPLLLAFGLYFGLWHSLQTLVLLQQDMQKSYPQILKASTPYLGASILGSLLLIAGLHTFHINIVLTLFIFISALTLPHAGVMHRLFRRTNQASLVAK